MRLFTGPPGSGKTAVILNELRAALRAGEAGSVRLLVPTATLAQHMQNELAREGFVFPPSVVQTLKQFIADWCHGCAGGSRNRFLLDCRGGRAPAQPRRVCRGDGVSQDSARRWPGRSRNLRRRDAIARGWPLAFPDAPLADAFLAVYQEVDRELARRGLALRARRLEIAAGRIAADGPGAVRTVWFDGFHALPEPELRLIAALGQARARHHRSERFRGRGDSREPGTNRLRRPSNCHRAASARPRYW